MIKNLQETVDYIKGKTSQKPQIGLILGSGLGSFADQLNNSTAIPYSELPHFPRTSVAGHKGQLVLGDIDGVEVAVLQGRVHYYEGYSMNEVAYPTRTLAKLGIKTLVTTNASGGLNPDMEPGSLMLITDHINFFGDSPLRGPNIDDFGPRFPDMTEAYNKELRDMARSSAKKLGIKLYEGTYTGVTGPCYETPAEVRLIEKVGGSAVGMSTVPEVIAAHHMGLKVCGLSCVSNLAAGLGQSKLLHTDVTEVAKRVEKTFSDLVQELVKEIGGTFGTSS